MHKLNNKKGIRQLHTVYPEHAEMLVKLVSGPHGFGSGSDVVRKAIVELYNKFYPPYKGPTFKQKTEIEEQQAFDALTDEQFALQVMKGRIVKDVLGRSFVMIYWFKYGSVAHFPLEGIKEWAEENSSKDAIEKHLEFNKEKDINEFEFVPFIKSAFERDHGIILP